MSPPRKSPCCRKCNSPMVGHKRPAGVPVCPQPHSQPPSPPRREIPIGLPQLPKEGVWHRVNPNWVNYKRRTPPSPLRHHSVISTVVSGESGADDAEEGEALEDDEVGTITNTPSSSQSRLGSNSPFTQVLKNCMTTPLASLFRTPAKYVTAVQTAAQHVGLRTGVVKRHRVKVEDGCNSTSEDEGVWMVIGVDGDAVDHLMDLQREKAHKRSAVGREVIVMESGRMGFGIVVVAGVLGGMLAVCALSLL